MMELWLLGTAVVFTIVGYKMNSDTTATDVVEIVIDRLITDGYIKTRGAGKDLEILKHWEE